MAPHDAKQLLEDEALEWNALVTLLQDEQTALLQGDISNLAQLSQSKLDRVRLLNRMVEDREAWQSQDPRRTSEAAATKALYELRETARNLNHQNGQIIDRRLHSVRKAVDILLGSAARQSIYDQGGQVSTRMSGQAISAA
ncbi:MAG: flagella synthesis protein FlgN [Thiobacillaceae bacterium]